LLWATAGLKLQRPFERAREKAVAGGRKRTARQAAGITTNLEAVMKLAMTSAQGG
jgi:hypothetical protein